MAEAASYGPSSAPATDNLGTPIGKRARSETFSLSVRTQPPLFVFPNEHFEFEFSIEGTASASRSPPTDFELLTSLININPTHAKNECFLEMLEIPRISPSRKVGTIRCFIRCPKVSRKHGCSLQIHLRANEEQNIAPCTTRTVSLVNAKLRVTMSAEFAATWYKDEGGRDKCMEGEVTLWNDRNEKLSESFVLDLVLCYAGEQYSIVSNQDLLRRIGTEQIFQIEGDSGKIRFRIEDVSKNHQGQNFVVKVSAGKGNIRDVAPAFTPPVSVRSKRNRQKQRPSSVRPQEQQQQQQPPMELSLPTPTSDTGRRSSINDQQSRVFEGADPHRIRNAVHSVARWAEEVVNSLYYMQWQVIGYEHRPDGTVDYSRPLHNIQNPNPTIDRMLSIYNETIREDIGYLQGALEPTPTSRGAAAVGGASNVRGSPYSAPPPTPIHSLAGSVQTPAAVGGGPYGSRPMQQHPNQPYTRPAPPSQPGPSTVGHHGDFNPYVAAQHPQPPPPPLPQPYLPSYYYSHEQQHHNQYRHPPLPSRAAAKSESPSPIDDPTMTSALDRESEVEYVLAKQYKSIRTGERLGFPAYSASYEILGFFRDVTKIGASQFDPIRPDEFGPNEKREAKKILENAIESKSGAVHALKDWGSIARLIDHCIVYNYSNDINIEDSTVGETTDRL